MRSIGREIATESAQESRAPLAFRRTVLPVFPLTSKLVLVGSYTHFVPFRAHTHTHTRMHAHAGTHIHTCAYTHTAPRFIFPSTALFHPTSIFSTNVLPGATLSVAFTQTTCRHVCARVRVDVCAPSYNSAQIRLNKGGRAKSSEHCGGLNWTPSLIRATITRPLLGNTKTK